MKEINVRKETSAKFKKHLSYNFSYGAFFAFIIIACFSLAYFFPSSLVLTVPLVIIPFTFAFQFNTSIDNTVINDQGFSLKRFLNLFKVYFQRQFFGVYRLIGGFFKSLAVFAGCYVFISFIMVQTLIMKDAQIASLVASIQESGDLMNLEETFYNTLLENETFINSVYLAFAIAFYPALYMFMHHIGTHSVKIHLSVASGQKMMMGEVHYIHKMGFPSFRRMFYKDYYKTVWWFIPVTAILYYGGMLVIYFFLYKTPFEMAIVGAALALLFISFFAPYYFSCIETLFIKYQDKYIEASISQSVKALNELKAHNQMSKEEEEEIEKYINQTKELLAKSQEETKEKSDEEQKNSDNSES